VLSGKKLCSVFSVDRGEGFSTFVGLFSINPALLVQFPFSNVKQMSVADPNRFMFVQCVLFSH
jgi:hypothetical protein